MNMGTSMGVAGGNRTCHSITAVSSAVSGATPYVAALRFRFPQRPAGRVLLL